MVFLFFNGKVYSRSIYATYGISDQVDVVVVLPYVQAKGNATDQVLTNLNLEKRKENVSKTPTTVLVTV
jgi:hypothetical protein